MFTEQIKVIEDNAISMLRMIPDRERETFDQIKEYLKEIFLSQHTMLSDPGLNQMTRFIMNEIRSAAITRQNADSVLLTVINNIGMKSLVEEYKEIVK